MKKLWETLSAPWQACVEQAWAAYRHNSLPIGAVITDAKGELIARGRNMGAYNDPAQHVLARSAVGHAEIVALGKVKRPMTLKGCVMYCSTEPCPMCAGAIRMARVGELRYASHDRTDGGIDILRATVGARPFAGRIQEPESRLLDVLLRSVLRERIIIWEKEAGRAGNEAKRPVTRAGVFAAYLAERGLLASLARQGAPAEGMLNTLEREFARRSWKPAPGGAARIEP